MTWSFGQLGPVLLGFLVAACGDGNVGPGAGVTAPESSQLSVVEVTTVTTVQGSDGMFLSPRPQQERPDYVERGAAAASSLGVPGASVDRAKVDTTLLFRAEVAGAFELELELGDIQPQHFFPSVDDQRWRIELDGTSAATDGETWSEWDGWSAFGGLAVGGAPAASLDYEQLGLPSPLVLGAARDSGGEHVLVTNRSDRAIAKALLVYSHEGGVGVRLVTDLAPGLSKVTRLGPKEHTPEVLLNEARSTLTEFFAGDLGSELGLAIARAKSIPFLEAHGLRLIYLLDEAPTSGALRFQQGFGEHRRVTVAQAEVLDRTEEEHLLQVVGQGLSLEDVPATLGRFARAKLEVASVTGDEQTASQAQQLLEGLTE